MRLIDQPGRIDTHRSDIGALPVQERFRLALNIRGAVNSCWQRVRAAVFIRLHGDIEHDLRIFYAELHYVIIKCWLLHTARQRHTYRYPCYQFPYHTDPPAESGVNQPIQTAISVNKVNYSITNLGSTPRGTIGKQHVFH